MAPVAMTRTLGSIARGGEPRTGEAATNDTALNRRQFLGNMASGFAGIALTSLLGGDGALADSTLNPEFDGGLHHRARAKRVIQLFMNGGASQCDLFDYKPKLAELHGRPFDPGAGRRVEASVSTPGAVMKSPFT
jgi:hypothetical protein